MNAKLCAPTARGPRRSLPAVVICLLTLLQAGPARAADSATVKKLFASPPREYASAPLWVWNDMLTEEEVRGTLRDLAEQNVKQVFVHPRPGLMTPYLSAEWFRLWKVALKEAERHDMNVWIYDENSYPSGFAGGWVPEAMPDGRGRGLHFQEVKTAPKWEANTLAVFYFGEDKCLNVSARIKAGTALPEGRYVVASVRRAPNTPWNANRSYVDLLYPGVTTKFLGITLGSYRREVGTQFGKRIPGVFTDEPELTPAGGLPWTEDLPQQFEKRWHYSLLENLVSLNQEAGDWQRVRHNYFSTLNDLFIQRWAKPYYEACAALDLEFTGHYWDHEWPRCTGVPDNMAMAAWQQRPGIDCLMNQYREDTHGQFGNVRMVRELASLANQLGRKRTLCEAYGAGGWDLRFEDMKRIADWLGVLGVNTFDQHLSYITIRGARKRDHPQSFSYHEPWWESYHVMASYLTRLSCALSQGEAVNRILVLEPTTTAWMYQGNEAKLKEIGDDFFKLLMALEAAQIEYDLGCEDVIAREGRLAGEKVMVDGATTYQQLRVGRRTYNAVVVPFMVENLNAGTDWLLKRLACVSFYGKASYPRVNGEDKGRKPYIEPTLPTAEAFIEAIPDQVRAASTVDGFFLKRTPGDKGILFHMRRQLDDGQILFLVNTSLEAPSSGTIEGTQKGVEQWNLFTGAVEPYAFDTTSHGLKASFSLPPAGSLLLCLTKQPRQSAPALAAAGGGVVTGGATEIRRLEPNVLTLDYVDVTAGGETRTNQYFYQASQFVWQKNGLERNPWDSAVQYKDELISRKFAPGSGFTASYRFTIDGPVPKNLAIVIERPDLYAITCNGRKVRARGSDWWLDKAFGKIPIAAAAHAGENVVTIEASPFTLFHELEPAYVLGDFSLRAVSQGFVIAADQPLQLGKWNEQGQPFFARGVTYRQQFEVPQVGGRYVVSLGKWYGSVANVLVNGKAAGCIASAPWECDVTKQLKRGRNEIEVEVIGTLKNTLGPHHGNPPLGSAWPAMFQKGPKDGPPAGSQYATVGYGLFEPFLLKQRPQ